MRLGMPRFRSLFTVIVTSFLVLAATGAHARNRMGPWSIGKLVKGNPIPPNPQPELAPKLWIPGDATIQSPINNADVQVFPSTDPQTEVSISVSYVQPLRMLITSNTVPSNLGQGYFYTFNAGAAWAGSNLYPNGNANFGDPVALHDNLGNSHDITLRDPSGIGLVSSADGGLTWGAFLNIDPTNSSGDDKEEAHVDRSPTSPYENRVYCAWTDFNLAPRISLVHSGDGYTSQHLIDAALGGDFGQGVDITTGPNGEVYACWAVYTGGFLPESGMGFASSANGGATFTPATVVFPYSGIRTGNGADPLFNNTRVNSFPSISCDISNGPNRGRIYITYSDRSTGDADIYCRYSSDGGASWSAAIRVNSDPVSNGKQQWFPWVDCDPVTGDPTISYYSMDTGGTGFDTKFWCAHSPDGGNTWDSFPVSDVYHTPTALPPPFAGGYAGDYYQVACNGGKAYAAWSDNRTGQYNVYFDTIVYADPNDPNPPSSITATSDCTTPTSVQLNWTDPTTQVDGDPLGNFEIYIFRNNVQVATVDQGIQTYTDPGLTTGTLYAYDLQTHDQDSDSLSIKVSISKYAGGDPTPNPPTLFTVASVPGPSFQLDWTNPTTNVDGSQLCDFAGVNVYRNSVYLATVPFAAGDIGDPGTYTDNAPVPGLNCYKLTAIDSEVPLHESVFTATVCVEIPLNPPFSDCFDVAGDPDNAKWTTGGVVVDNLAANPPTPPNAADFDGADVLTSRPVDMTGQGGNGYVFLYQKEQTGNGESPDPNNDLIVEFYNSDGIWDEVGHHFGTDPDETSFTTEVIPLDSLTPSSGTYFHSQFRMRFRATGDEGFDNWFVDCVTLDIPSCGPTVSVSPLSVSDALVAGTPVGASVPVTVSNSCQFSALNWAAAESPDVSWLTLSSASGTIGGLGSQNFVAHFNAIGMSPGVYNTDIEVTSNDGSNPSIIVTATLTVNPAPDIDVSPTSITNTLANVDPPAHDPVTIRNVGAGPLTFSILDAASGVRSWAGAQFIGIKKADGTTLPTGAPVALKPNPAKAAWYAARLGDEGRASKHIRTPLDPTGIEPGDRVDDESRFKGFGDEGQFQHYPPQPFSQGGPDGDGYRWIDSDESGGPTFSWVDITGVGTNTGLSGDDENLGPFGLGFTFQHYENAYSSIRVCSNGWASFSSSSTAYSNTPLPDGTAPFDLVAPYWDDMYLPAGGSVYYYADGANNRFIVEWVNVPSYADNSVLNTFEAIINKDGTILYQYLDIGEPSNSATVGVQNTDGTVGLQVAYNQFYVHNSLATLIYQDASWLSATPTSGTVNPGDSAILDVVSDPTGKSPGTYYGNVLIVSNDPDEGVTDVHVTLNVTGSGVPLPFCDQFNDASGVPDPAKWTNSGVVLNGVGLNEPSLPTSANFNQTDAITSVQIDMSAAAGTGKVLLYYVEQGGGGEPPDPANDFIVEFKNSTGTWDQVDRRFGADPEQTNYELRIVSLDGLTPSAGTYFYNLFQMRIRTTGDGGSDDWFLDDLCITDPPCQPTITVNPAAVCDTLVAGTVGTPKNLNIMNSCGFATLIFNIVESPDQPWLTVVPTNGAVVGASSTAVQLTFDATTMLPGTYNTSLFVISNDPVTPSVTVPICLKVTGAPHAVIQPDSLCPVIAVIGGPVIHRAASIHNSGVVPLTWRLYDTQGIPAAPGQLGTASLRRGDPQPNEKKLEMFKDYLDLPEFEIEPGTMAITDPEAKGYENPYRGGLQPYGAGGPDAAGYRWIDSDDPSGPAFQWTEIDGAGGTNTGIACDDCNVGPFALGFTMPFYGVNYNSIRVCSNGFLSFTSTLTSFTNQCPLSATTPNALVAPFWDDLDLRTRGRVVYRSDAALGRFIMEWKQVAKFGAAAGDTFTFQAVLWKDGSIYFNYLAMKGVRNSATIGIKDATGATRLQVSCNTNYVHDQMTILLQNEQEWLSATPTSGTVPPGGTQLLNVAFDPTGVPAGNHRGFLRILTNDPQQPKAIVPVCLSVLDPIPVVLSKFEAVSLPEGLKIVWETSEEANHAYFDILRAEGPSEDYQPINTAPINGSGHFEFLDTAVIDGADYKYRLEAVDRGGARQSFGPLVATYSGRPATFQLVQNYPNPFQGHTAFELSLPATADVRLRIFDATGRLVRSVHEGTMEVGRHTFEWDGRDDTGQSAAAGFYFLRAESTVGSKTVRMMLMK